MWMQCEWMFGDAQELKPEERNGFAAQLKHDRRNFCYLEYELIPLFAWLSLCGLVWLVFCVFSVTVCTCVWLCMCWRVLVWTLDQQLISHAGRHQRRLELTLRVEATLHAIRNFPSPSLQQHQTYMPIHIEMNKWSLAMQQIAILRWGEIKLQTSWDAYGSFSSFFFFRVHSGHRWSGSVLCLCFKCGRSATIMFSLIKGSIVFPLSYSC